MVQRPHQVTRLKVFISYSRKDMNFADRLEAALKADGIEPLIDRSEIYAFEDWWKRIQTLISQADTIVFILSPDAVASEVCQKEVAFAASLSKRFAPIVFRHVDVTTVPKELSQLNFIFFDDETKFSESFARLSEALSTNIDWVRRHTEFGTSARNWDTAKRPAGLLLRSPLLEEAEQWIASRPVGAPELTAETRDFIVQSRRATTHRRNLLTGSLSAGLILALALAGLAYWQRGLAQMNEQRAKQQRNEALLTQSKYLADKSTEVLEARNDPGTALLLALEALRDEKSDDESTRDRPYWSPAEVSMEAALRRLREILVLKGHTSSVTGVAIMPDGSRVVTGSYDNTVRIWSSETGRELLELKGHSGPVTAVAITHDGTRIVSGSHDKTARVWDARSGEVLLNLKGHDGEVTSVAVSPDGTRVVTGSSDKTARVWDGTSGALLLDLRGHDEEVTSVAVTPDGARVVTGSHDKTARVWDANNGGERLTLSGHADGITSVAVTLDGNHIITGSNDQTARVWDANSGLSLGDLRGHTEAITSVAVIPDATRVLTSAQDGTARIWDMNTRTQITLLGGHASSVFCAAVSPDGARIVTGSGDNTVRIWDARIAAWHVSLTGHDGEVMSTAVARDASRIATGANDHTARLWDTKSGALLRVLRGHESGVFSVALTPDGGRVVTGSNDHTVRIWDANTGTELRILKGHSGAVTSIAVTPDGARIATGSLDKSVRIWDAESGSFLGRLVGHSDIVSSVIAMPDGTGFVTGSSDGTVRIWEADRQAVNTTGDWRTTAQFRRPESKVYSLATDGAHIISGWSDGTVLVWNIKCAAAVLTYKAHSNAVTGVARTLDGSRIITSSADRTVRLWHTNSGDELGVLRGHTAPIASLAITQDGSRIITGSWDSTARIWELFPSGQDLVQQAKTLAPRCLTSMQRKLYHLIPVAPSWCETMERWPNDSLTVANDHLEHDRWQEAIAAFDRVIERDPTATARLAPLLATAHAMIAWRAFLDVTLQGKPADALKGVLANVNKATSLAPDEPRVLYIRGQILLAVGRPDEALVELDKAIGLGADETGIYYARGRAHEHRGNKEAAIADYRKALELPDLGDSYLKLVRTQASERLLALGVRSTADGLQPK